MKTKICVACLLIFVVLCLVAVGGLFLNTEHNKQPDVSENPSDTSAEVPAAVVDWSDVAISCLGDSITNGGYLGTSGITYPVLLQEQLGTLCCGNYGIGASTCSNVRENSNAMCYRYTDMPKSSDIIIVMCGYNDSNSATLGTIDDYRSDTYYGALNILCSGLKENYPNAWVFFMTSFHYAKADDINSFGYVYKDYWQTAVKEVCEIYGFDVFDTYAYFDFDQTTDTVDTVHPAQNFITNRWVPAIAQYIKANYPGKTAA